MSSHPPPFESFPSFSNAGGQQQQQQQDRDRGTGTGGLTSSASALVSTLKAFSSSTFKEAFNGLRIGVTRAARGMGDLTLEGGSNSGERAAAAAAGGASSSAQQPGAPGARPGEGGAFTSEGFTSLQLATDQAHRVARFIKLLDEAVVRQHACLAEPGWTGGPRRDTPARREAAGTAATPEPLHAPGRRWI